jgi:hypothetical protein
MATSTMAIDSTQEYSVVAPSEARRFEVRENYDSSSAPTCDLIQAMPLGGTAVKVAKGTSAIYTRSAPWIKGDVIGSIKTSSGSCTVAIIPGDQV